MNPPKRKIDNKVQPYYPVTYRQGTVCDLTGKPRSTTVIYACNLVRILIMSKSEQ